MRIKLKTDKSIEFLDGSGTINTNDVIRQVLEVELERPLAIGESLWIVYAANEFTYTGEILFREDTGVYKMLIPQEIINIPREWSVQLFVRLYSTTNPTKYVTQLSSDIASFTVRNGLPLENGMPVNSATVGNLWNETKKNAETSSAKASEAASAAGLATASASTAYGSETRAEQKAKEASDSATNAEEQANAAEISAIRAESAAERSETAYDKIIQEGTAKYVTLDTEQKISGKKTFDDRLSAQKGLSVTGPVNIFASEYQESPNLYVSLISDRMYVIPKDVNSKAYAVKYPAEGGMIALKEPIDLTIEGINHEIENVYTILGETVYLEQPVTQEYTTRETAAGLEIIDGALTAVKEIRGKTVATTNLIPYPYYNSTKTENGLTWTDNGDGTITVNGTPTGYTDFIFSTRLAIHGIFTLSGISASTNLVYTVTFRKSDGVVITSLTNAAITFNTADYSDYNYIEIAIKRDNNNIAINNVIVRPMLNAGSEAKPYSKWFAGLKNASFKGITSTGKNLNGGDNVLKNKVIANAPEGIIIDSVTHNTLLLPVNPSETYHLTGYTEPTGETLQYVIYDQGMNVITYNSSDSAVTIPEDGAYLGCSYYNQNAEVMCERGTSATAYEPYISDTLSAETPIELPEYDVVYPETGETKRQSKTLVFDGTENWTANTNYIAFSLDLPSKGIAFTSICSPYRAPKITAWNQLKDYEAQNGELVLLIKDSTYSTLEAWKAHLAELYAAGDPLTVTYKTAEATIEATPFSKSKYIARKGGSETIKQGPTDNSEYGAEDTVTQTYAIKRGDTI